MKGSARRVTQAATIALALAVLAVPPLVVVNSGSAGASSRWTSLRLLALYAFTLLFVNVVTGAARPLFNRVFKPRRVYVFHNHTGLLAIILAAGHMVLAWSRGVSFFVRAYIIMGIIAISLLAVTVAAALAKKHLKKSWRYLHRLNYLLFPVVVMHAWFLGFDFRHSGYGNSKADMQVAALVYSAIVLLAVGYRLYNVIESRKKRMARAVV